jgi:mono/diheme cytochrome c family protein
MKKVLKIVLFFFIGILLLIFALLGYVKVALPDVGKAPDLKIDYTAERIARGKYLANDVAVCMDCHSKRDYSKFGGPSVPGTFGQGGEHFGKEAGFPGDYYSANITPAGLKDWTDGEIYRAITSGVSKDGHALFSIMPYPNYGMLDKEDIYSIISYVRTLTPIPNEVPKSSSDFPMNFIINTIPRKASHTPIPPKSDLVAYGKYLAVVSSCKDCHTPMEKGSPIEGKSLAGGFDFHFPDGTIVQSSNITPDKSTGIGNMTQDQFLALFKTFADSSFVPAPIRDGEFKTVMPWLFYSKMKDEDLKAIYAYLQSVPAVENAVVKFSE